MNRKIYAQLVLGLESIMKDLENLEGKDLNVEATKAEEELDRLIQIMKDANTVAKP